VPVPAAQSQLFSPDLPSDDDSGDPSADADRPTPPHPKAPRPRPSSERPKAEPKLEFRLIDENPRPARDKQ
jgi:hypothetical protein